MDYVIILIICCSYLGISAKLDKIIDKQVKDKNKKFPSLKELIGKEIMIEVNEVLDFNFNGEIKGILKGFDDTWVVMEIKNKKQFFYFRLQSISIDII